MPLHLSDAGIAARITLDDPATRNALSPQSIADLDAALARAAAEESVRCVVLAHTGSTFCSGANLAAAREVGVERAAAAFIGLLRRILTCPKPVIAEVSGHVRAGGVGVLAACDIAHVAQDSTFATTETRIGVAPAMIALTVLPRMGARAASHRLLTATRFDAAAALDYGLVTTVSSDPAAATATTVADLAHCSPQGLRETKALLNADVVARFDADAERLATLSAQLFHSPEAAEGMAAFLEKRPPRWAQPPKDSPAP